MYLIYYCCLVDYAIRLTCKCIAFSERKDLFAIFFDHCHSCNQKTRHIIGINIVHAKLSVLGFYFLKK